MAAACTVSPHEASRLLDVRQSGKHNEVPDREYFRSAFDFSRTDLLEYVAANVGLPEVLLGKSYDQRSTPSAFMEEVPGGYNVGWYDGERKEQRFHDRVQDAATDFVLMFWNIPRG